MYKIGLKEELCNEYCFAFKNSYVFEGTIGYSCKKVHVC